MLISSLWQKNSPIKTAQQRLQLTRTNRAAELDTFTTSKMIEMNQLYRIFEKCWSVESSSKWEEGNPCKGQCSVTALVVHNHFGGSILKTNVNGQWHFYNKIDNQVLDLTSKQFNTPIDYQDIESTVEEALSDSSQRQYEYLKRQFTMHYLEDNSKTNS